MKRSQWMWRASAATFAAAMAAVMALAVGGHAKHKNETPVDPNDSTYRLFQLLDDSHEGKLDDFCVLADDYPDPDHPNQTYQHVLRADYDKNRAFGKLTLYVRAVSKMTPDQLAMYTPKQAFDFGETDLEKYVKTNPGPLGIEGDLYLRSGTDTPLESVPITDDIRKKYDDFVNLYLLPALQKK
ncbi:MAG TPA: hypothetical protein VGW33_00590 [Terriglobia bacterium]|nr:hypothetical protein [Terriglobia bacterium]